MKILRKDAIARRNQKIHTKSERMILENMTCPFIVQLHYAFQTSDKLYMVMDFMNGGTIKISPINNRGTLLPFEKREEISRAKSKILYCRNHFGPRIFA